MKRTGIIALVLSFILILSYLVVPAAAQESGYDNTVVNGAHSVDGKIPVLGSNRLVDNVESALVLEVGSDTLMYAWNADARVSPASFVKIMTALIVAEQSNLSESVRVKQEILDTIPGDAASANLIADEVLTVEQLLYCMMVGSANDAAAVLADHVAGSQESFVSAMNRYADQLGCTDTKFTNVHGLHDDEQYTTVRDVVRILSAAIKNEAFCAAFEAEYYTVPATNKSAERSFTTGNFLMNDDTVEIYYDTRVTGGRTGVTSTGHRCIAVTAEKNGMKVISVITGSASEYEEDGYTTKIYGGYTETSALLDAALEGYKAVQIVSTNQIMGQYSVDGGSSDVTVASTCAVSTVLPEHVTSDDLSYRFINAGSSLKAPIDKGQHLINMEIWYQNACVAQVELVAMNRVTVEENRLDLNRHEGGKISWVKILIVAACVLGAGMIVFIAVRTAKKFRILSARKRSRRYRMNRRRSR